MVVLRVIQFANISSSRLPFRAVSSPGPASCAPTYAAGPLDPPARVPFATSTWGYAAQSYPVGHLESSVSSARDMMLDFELFRSAGCSPTSDLPAAWGCPHVCSRGGGLGACVRLQESQPLQKHETLYLLFFSMTYYVNFICFWATCKEIYDECSG